MDKDIREMTLGEIEDLILKQYNKVEKSHYWLFDKKKFIDNLIKDFQKELKF